MRDARQDQRVEIAEDGLEGLGRLRRLRGQGAPEIPGADLRHDGPFGDPGAKIGDSVDEFMPDAAEVFRRHVHPPLRRPLPLGGEAAPEANASRPVSRVLYGRTLARPT